MLKTEHRLLVKKQTLITEFSKQKTCAKNLMRLFLEQVVGHHKSASYKSCDKMSTFRLTAGWSSQMCPKVINIITNGSQNPVTKRPHFAEQPLGHNKCGQKTYDKTSTFCWKAGWTSQTCQQNPVTKRSHFAEQPAGHHKGIQISYEKPSKVHFRKGWKLCHRSFWGGWTSCHMGQTVHLKAGDEKYLDVSYRCKNVTVANLSQQTVRWSTDSMGQIFPWSICWWTDRQGTTLSGVECPEVMQSLCL